MEALAQDVIKWSPRLFNIASVRHLIIDKYRSREKENIIWMYNIILWNSNFRHTNRQCTNIGLSRDIEAGLSLLPYKMPQTAQFLSGRFCQISIWILDPAFDKVNFYPDLDQASKNRYFSKIGMKRVNFGSLAPPGPSLVFSEGLYIRKK